MTSATPSSPYFNGSIYIPSFFTSSTGTYLNYALAQGTETISTLKHQQSIQQHQQLL